jgi:hypothetical protein
MYCYESVINQTIITEAWSSNESSLANTAQSDERRNQVQQRRKTFR